MGDTVFSPIDSLVTSPWTIKNANGAGNVDEYRMAISIGAQLTDWYGRRINALMDEVSADSSNLQEMTKVAGESWDLAAGDSYALTHNLERWGVAYPLDSARVTVLGQTEDFPYPPTVISNVAITWNPDGSTDQMDETAPRFTDYQYGTIYEDSKGARFVWAPPQGVFGSYPVFNYIQRLDTVEAWSTVYPQTLEDFSKLQDAISAAAGKLTQNSQAKQAFLQDLTASMNKFFNWTSNILQRDEKNKQDILAKF
jgi:hypothetical protein